MRTAIAGLPVWPCARWPAIMPRRWLPLVLVLLVAWATVRAQEVTLNLKNAEIGALIDTVAGITGRNFIVDPRVKGTVTVVSSTPMSDKEIYEIFLSILKVHGYTAVDTGKTVQIIPVEDAKTDSSLTPHATLPGSGEEVITRVIEVRNTAAAQLVPVLRPLVPQAGHLAAAPTSNAIVITDRASNVEHLAQIIARIDGANETEIEVVPLQHAAAAEVVRVLSMLVDDAAKADTIANKPKLSADERTNTVLIRGDKEQREHLRGLVLNLDTPKAVGGNTHVINLRYANAKDLVAVLEGVVKSSEQPDKQAQATAAGLKTTIQADESVNALVITAPPDVLASLLGVIDRLDTRRKQVLVEALIAEVGADRAAELGIQWRATDNPKNSGAFGGTNFNLTGNGINQLSVNPAAVGDGLSLGFIDGTVSVLGKEILNLGALVRLLAADSATNILSTPSLVTLDNEEAKIVVGQNVPFVTGQFTATGAAQGAANPFQTIVRQDVGITLRVKPQINEGNAVRLDIQQEVSSISPNVSGTNAADIITNKRSINTSVLVDDKKIVVLGGLIQDDVKENNQRVPVLGDIPVLGNLFRFQRTEKTKKNLMVFLTPTILHDSREHTAATDKRYQDLRDLQQQRREQGVALMPKEQQPQMNELLGLPPDFTPGRQ